MLANTRVGLVIENFMFSTNQDAFSISISNEWLFAFTFVSIMVEEFVLIAFKNAFS